MTDAHDKIHTTGRREMFYLGVCLTCEEEKTGECSRGHGRFPIPVVGDMRADNDGVGHVFICRCWNACLASSVVLACFDMPRPAARLKADGCRVGTRAPALRGLAALRGHCGRKLL